MPTTSSMAAGADPSVPIIGAEGDDLRPRSAPSARSVLLTVLGEFVLPRTLDGAGGVWTSTLIAALGQLGYSEQNARAAIAGLADRGLLERERRGRQVRWLLTDSGQRLLVEGAQRIYSFLDEDRQWDGHWLVLVLSVAEDQRSLRHQVRRRLGFLGFGPLTAGVLISPRIDSEPATRAVLGELGLTDEALLFRAETGDDPQWDEPGRIISRTWDLDALAEQYRTFVANYGRRRPGTGGAGFVATVEIVHDWRRFLFDDPEIPLELLPADWPGRAAREVFDDCRGRWSPAGRAWFDHLEDA